MAQPSRNTTSRPALMVVLLAVLTATNLTVRAADNPATRPSHLIIAEQQWKIVDHGWFVDAEDGVFHLRSAQGGKGAGGWFKDSSG